MHKFANTVAMLCALSVGAGMLWATGPLRGWVVLAACGIMSVVLLLSRATSDRLVTLLIGAYTLLTGVSAGLPRIWTPTPRWVNVIAEVAFWGSLIAMLSAAWFIRRRHGVGRQTIG